jgi:hypothetical protein
VTAVQGPERGCDMLYIRLEYTSLPSVFFKVSTMNVVCLYVVCQQTQLYIRWSDAAPRAQRLFSLDLRSNRCPAREKLKVSFWVQILFRLFLQGLFSC